MARILILRWTPAEREGRIEAERLKALAVACHPWRELISRRGVVLLYMPDKVDDAEILLPDERGLVVGRLFCGADAHGYRRVGKEDMGCSTIEQWCADGAAEFSRTHWGDYLLILHDRGHDNLLVMRNPMGTHAVYHADLEGGRVHLVFSHADDYVTLSERADVDDDYLRGFIARPRLVSARTALKGVRELLPGQSLMLGRDSRLLKTAWRPVPPQRYSASAFAWHAQHLQKQALAAARAWVGDGERILHQLSGGFDSSVVLALLRASAPKAEICCINQRPSEGAEGDERRFARIAAAHAGAQLLEQELAPAAINYANIRLPDLPAKPSLAHISFASPPLGGLAEQHWSFLTSGKGGDQVFQRSAPAILAADAARERGGVEAWMRVCGDLARRNKSSVWPVLSAQILHGVLRRPFNPRRLLGGVGALATEEGDRIAVDEFMAHPWLEDWRAVPPGALFRARRLMDLQYYANASSHQANFVCANLLTAQPIVEACLAVPAYAMVQGGGDRALARRAFGAMIAPETLARVSKGETTRYAAAVMVQNRDLLRGYLLDGVCVARRLCDHQQLGQALNATHAPAPTLKASVSAVLAVEIWLNRFHLAMAARQERDATAP